MQADAVDPQAMHDEMAVLANTTTEEDYEKMEEDGYSVNDTEIPEIVTEMDKIKIQLAKAGVDIRIFGDDVSVEKIAEVLGSAGVGQIERHCVWRIFRQRSRTSVRRKNHWKWQRI